MTSLPFYILFYRIVSEFIFSGTMKTILKYFFLYFSIPLFLSSNTPAMQIPMGICVVILFAYWMRDTEETDTETEPKNGNQTATATNG